MEAVAVQHGSTVRPSLTAAIDRAVDETDPVLANLLITQTHHDLGLALRDLLGADTGANFHAWATWGSREAGTTIRMADLPGLHRFPPARPALHRARDRISAGNRLVLDEIGRESARFIAAGGLYESEIDGLHGAFSGYRDAMAPAPVAHRRITTFSANFDAVWHEHVRLQPYIAGAMPRGLRHVITRGLLDFRVGEHRCHVARGLVRGTGAHDWSSFRQRMRYVHELFRSYHLDPAVFAAPYGQALTRELRRELGLT
jgi:hypothetical protein